MLLCHWLCSVSLGKPFHCSLVPISLFIKRSNWSWWFLCLSQITITMTNPEWNLKMLKFGGKKISKCVSPCRERWIHVQCLACLVHSKCSIYVNSYCYQAYLKLKKQTLLRGEVTFPASRWLVWDITHAKIFRWNSLQAVICPTLISSYSLQRFALASSEMPVNVLVILPAGAHASLPNTGGHEHIQGFTVCTSARAAIRSGCMHLLL